MRFINSNKTAAAAPANDEQHEGPGDFIPENVMGGNNNGSSADIIDAAGAGAAGAGAAGAVGAAGDAAGAGGDGGGDGDDGDGDDGDDGDDSVEKAMHLRKLAVRHD